MSSLLRLERREKDFLNSFFLNHLELKRQLRSYTPVLTPWGRDLVSVVRIRESPNYTKPIWVRLTWEDCNSHRNFQFSHVDEW